MTDASEELSAITATTMELLLYVEERTSKSITTDALSVKLHRHCLKEVNKKQEVND